MDCEVIVVGGGIGGLVTAALLAARGVDVCLFERQSRVGGCVASFNHLDYSFEPTAGLYSGWEAGGTWERIFSELPLQAPAFTKLSPSFVVRLANGVDIEVSDDRERLESNIAAAFPSSDNAASNFLRELDRTNNHPVADSRAVALLLANTAREFRDFIDVQLQTFAQCASSECSLARAAEVLAVAHGRLWSIDGGAQVLADRLADSLCASGGRLRLDAPVLRLAYASDGVPIGVDLLSGERVVARRAIISNLTVWDTYGKLIGLSRTPKSIAACLKNLSAWGAYSLFLATEDPTRLTASRMLVVCGRDYAKPYEADSNQLVINLARQPAPSGNWPVTVTTFTASEDWFSFHEDGTSHEKQDQHALETRWKRLHHSIPELGSSVEVIDTATPQTSYETTRRKLGFIGNPSPQGNASFARSPFPNVFLVGDTVCSGIGIEGVAQSAYRLANFLTNRSY